MQRMYGSAFAVTETRKFRTYHVNFPHPNTLISSKKFPFPFSYRFQQNLHKLHFIFEFGEKKNHWKSDRFLEPTIRLQKFLNSNSKLYKFYSWNEEDQKKLPA